MELIGKPHNSLILVTGIVFEPASIASTQLGRCLSSRFENLAVAPWRGRLVISLQVGKPANYDQQVRRVQIEPTVVESKIYLSSATAAVRPHRVHPFERTFIRTTSGATIGAPVGESGTVLVKLVLPRAKSSPAAAAEGLLSKGDFDGALQALEPCLGKGGQEACQVLEIVALRFRDGPGDLEKALQAHEVFLSRGGRSSALQGLDQLLQIELR